MSIENHPNFHAVQFVTDITTSYFKSIRGKAAKLSMDDKIRDMIIDFAENIEDNVDERIR